MTWMAEVIVEMNEMIDKVKESGCTPPTLRRWNDNKTSEDHRVEPQEKDHQR